MKYYNDGCVFTTDVCSVTYECGNDYNDALVVSVDRNSGGYFLNITESISSFNANGANGKMFVECSKEDCPEEFLKIVDSEFLQIDVMKLIVKENLKLMKWL